MYNGAAKCNKQYEMDDYSGVYALIQDTLMRGLNMNQLPSEEA